MVVLTQFMSCMELIPPEIYSQPQKPPLLKIPEGQTIPPSKTADQTKDCPPE